MNSAVQTRVRSGRGRIDILDLVAAAPTTKVARLLAYPRLHNSAQPMQITFKAHEAIRATVGALPAETGGILGGDPDSGLITHFVFDERGSRSSSVFTPDIEHLNHVIRTQWKPAGIRLLGFVHSHPNGVTGLSSRITDNPYDSDAAYVRAILPLLARLREADPPDERYAAPLERFYVPIVQTEPDSGLYTMHGYAARHSGSTVTLETCNVVLDDVDMEETYSRVVDAYDLARLARCRVIYVGAGGASQFIEDMARAGVGEHILIDPDTVSVTNIATQQVYRRDVGRLKVDCIAERVRDINPGALVMAIPELLDAVSDAQFTDLAHMAMRDGRAPLVTLICGLTDNFAAQARVNRLALQLGISSLLAQVYREGRAAEITFTHPQTTVACNRCILSSRYKAHLMDGFVNNVTSHGTPIFATTRLNALKGFLAMALLHHGMEPSDSVAYARFGTLLTAIGTRNLVQIRMDHDLRNTLGLAVFDKVHRGGRTSRIFMDDVVWLPQEAESAANGYAPCPDCGGGANLAALAGRIADTTALPLTWSAALPEAV